MYKVTRSTLVWVLFVTVFLGSHGRLTAQEPIARSLSFTVTADGLQFTRGATVNGIPLQRDAIAVMGTGDTLITDGYGRTLVDLDGSGTLLIMPDSRVTFADVSERDGQLAVSLMLDGHIIVSLESSPAPSVSVETSFLQIQIEGASAIWTNYEQGDVVSVDRGSASYSIRGQAETTRIAAGAAVYVNANESLLAPLRGRAPFLHAAQLLGVLRGCAAQVSRTGSDSLNVRVAPGLGASVIGYIDSGDAAIVMGASESGNWRRVQRFSGFGWMLAAYLRESCTELTAFPNDSFERNLELVELQPPELMLLTPFYGTPEQNLWVYRSFRESPYADES
ncbi:MAG: SH3 domain-containing protein [Chloroflexota bacterium]|nr:SH3 domain-containing protein [Chloroflexota bacterium]